MFQIRKLWFQLFAPENKTALHGWDFSLCSAWEKDCFGEQWLGNECHDDADFDAPSLPAEVDLQHGELPVACITWLPRCPVPIHCWMQQEALDRDLYITLGQDGWRSSCFWFTSLNHLIQIVFALQTPTICLFHDPEVWKLRCQNKRN